MKYKALILDLDGTTIPNKFDGFPSVVVKQAIAQVRNKIHICIATGRNIELVSDILEQLHITDPCILLNGSQIYDPITKKLLKELYIPKEHVVALIEVFALFGYKAKYAPGSHLEVSTSKTEEILNIYVDGINPRDAKLIGKEFQKIPQIVCHKMTSWKKGFFDMSISHPEASKQSGVLEIARLLKITPQEIIGVGDSYNDFSLLMACGLKFAMGNAVDEVKAIADFVAPSVENDGVAVIIEKFILPLLED